MTIAAAAAEQGMQTFAGVTASQLWDVARRLVGLEPDRTLWDLSRLKDDLDSLVGTPVDVVTEGGLSRYIRERVLAESIAL